jgi:hypothetical protein
MLYDPLAVKRLASAVCVLPPTPRSLIGPSGCQGCESASTTESAREPGLDAGAPGRLYCVALQEDEQQRPGVGYGIVLRSMTQPGEPGAGTRTSLGSRTLRHRAIPEERPRDLPRSAATSRGRGGVAHQQPGTRLPSTSGTSQRCAPAGGVPVTPLGATLLRLYGASGRATARTVAGGLPRFGRKPRAAQQRRPAPRSWQGGEAPVPTGAAASGKTPSGGLGGRMWRQASLPGSP